MGGRCCSERKQIPSKAALKLEDVERFCAKSRRCDLPEPETEPVGVGERQYQTYVVTNKYLQATSPGLAYRTTKKLDCLVQHEYAFAPWDESLVGHDDNDGWLRVGRVFLPFKVQGIQVIVDKKSETGEDRNSKSGSFMAALPNHSNVPRKLRCQRNPDAEEDKIPDAPRKLRCQMNPDAIPHASAKTIVESGPTERVEEIKLRQTSEVSEQRIEKLRQRCDEHLRKASSSGVLEQSVCTLQATALSVMPQVHASDNNSPPETIGLQDPTLTASASSLGKSPVFDIGIQKKESEASDDADFGSPRSTKKREVRAALKHAATVGDLDVLRSGLKEAGDLGVGASDIKVAWESLAATKRHVEADRVKQSEHVTRDETVVAEMRSGLEKQEFSAQASMRRGARKDEFGESVNKDQQLDTLRSKQDLAWQSSRIQKPRGGTTGHFMTPRGSI